MKKHASAAPRHPEDPSRTSEPGRSDSASAPLPDVPHLRTAKQRRLEPLAFIFDAVQVQRQPQTARFLSSEASQRLLQAPVLQQAPRERSRAKPESARSKKSTQNACLRHRKTPPTRPFPTLQVLWKAVPSGGDTWLLSSEE